ncbi:LysR substrate-binding domain-containing protein [Saccharibacillus sp. CPCC 101409]|uniref:LysR substrate-binding domain-containing protein n=1 Tax=Saccharibacillus sp. CPCC 101409 TaxID=3058041 RepID=UPI00267140F2|nr:LysR substrate-binding domain-containing protein [Saccharibacillus sp. CPCC 101409]MDO3409453.1 LysR substrate-binding domain-containing protein [Saccharibacillus sp. CPCC 101409]
MEQQLRVFVKVAEKGHFSRAAALLHMSQPAVSQHIRTLEQEVGSQLLERNNKQVRMTRAGEIVYAHAKEILDLHARMRKRIDDLDSRAAGPLFIGASYTFGEYILPRAVAGLKAAYPDVAPSVTIGNTASIASKVRAGELDIGIVEGHPRDLKELHAEALAEDRILLAASPEHPLARREGEWPAPPNNPFHLRLREDLNRIDRQSGSGSPFLEPIVPEALSACAWVLRESGSGTREAADEALDGLGVVPSEVLVFNSMQAVKEAVIAGLGIGLFSKWAIRRELNSGELCILDVPGLPHIRQCSIVTASAFRNRALDVFIELLRERRELTGLDA